MGAKAKNQKKKSALKKTFHRIYRHVQRFLVKNSTDNISALAGQSAFFMILSVVPFIVFFFFLVAMIFGEPQAEITGTKVAEVNNSSVTDFSSIISDFLVQLYNNRSHTVIVTVVMTLWSAGKGMYIITDGISRIYGIPIRHSWIFRRVFAMGYTFVMLLMLLLTASILTLNATIQAYLSTATEGLPLATQVLFGLRYVITTVIMTLFLTIVLKLYLRRRIKNNHYTKFRVLLPGMLFTSVSWSVLTWGIEFYSTHFSSSIYGGFGAVFILMLWIYFVMYLLLWGIQINCIYREQFYRFSFRKLFGRIGRKFSGNRKKQTAQQTQAAQSGKEQKE